MKFTPKRYKMMFYMLTHEDFAQRELAKKCLESTKFGATVNKFVRELEDLGFVAQTGSIAKGGQKYQIISPVGLISFYSKFRKMSKLDSFTIGESRDEIMEYLDKKGTIFCLNTALSKYDTHFVDPAIYAYLPKEKQGVLEDEIKNMRSGKILVNLYHYDLEDKIVEIDGKKFTSQVRTIIDLYCDKKSNQAETFIREVW